MIVFRVNVVGKPAPQGSKTNLGKGRMIESSKAVKPWREAVRSTCVEEMAKTGFNGFKEGPVRVSIQFHLARPKSHYGTGANAGKLKASAPSWHPVKPDLDKLERATLDGLSDAGVFSDDAQVASLPTDKWYVDGWLSPCAVISVRSLSDG